MPRPHPFLSSVTLPWPVLGSEADIVFTIFCSEASYQNGGHQSLPSHHPESSQAVLPKDSGGQGCAMAAKTLRPARPPAGFISGWMWQQIPSAVALSLTFI